MGHTQALSHPSQVKISLGQCRIWFAKKNILKEMGSIHHQGLRVALVAYRTSLTPSLYAEAGEPSLKHGRLKLNYNLKIKYLPENPCFDHINNPQPPLLFDNPKTDPPFGTLILPHIVEADIDPTSIDSRYERTPPFWEQNKV